MFKHFFLSAQISLAKLKAAKLSGFIFCMSLLAVLSSCSVNPVTGKQELAWVDESWERKIGKKAIIHFMQNWGAHVWD